MFLRAWERRRLRRTRASVLTWILTIARNAAIDAVRPGAALPPRTTSSIGSCRTH
ncbi:sigma factor [Ruania alba]|uniref:sigma factor n=1 Tax=Ruania alba TaxID=648782 RepID=UPI003CCC39D6